MINVIIVVTKAQERATQVIRISMWQTLRINKELQCILEMDSKDRILHSLR